MLRTPTRPAEEPVAITPNDSTVFPATRGVYVGITGDLHVTLSSGVDAVFVGLAAGLVHPLSVIRVYATSTTADSILGLR
jgi:hypothetical protein